MVVAGCSDTEDSLPPADLSYPADELTVIAGQSASSGKPTLLGTPPFRFELSGNITSGISIDEEGEITVDETAAVGSYSPVVTVSNSAGSRIFPDLIAIEVNADAVLPTTFSYSPNTGETPFGTAFSSAAPQTNGSGDLNFSITSTPSGGNQLTIGPDGTINAGTGLAAGTYVINVRVTSATGSLSFENAFTLNVKAPGNTASFQRDIRSILQQSCTGCHSNYSDYETVKKDADMIINRIQRSPGSVGFMPQGGQALSQAQIDLIKKWKDEGFAN